MDEDELEEQLKAAVRQTCILAKKCLKQMKRIKKRKRRRPTSPIMTSPMMTHLEKNHMTDSTLLIQALMPQPWRRARDSH